MLSAIKIKNARPGPRAYKLADSGGLYLLVQPNGSKLWRYKFRIDRTEGLHAIGAFPEVSLAEARDLHSASRRLVAQGISPVRARKDRKIALAQAQLERVKGSFGVVMTDWAAATAVGLRSSTQRQREREINNDLIPRLRDQQIGSITRMELSALLKNVEQRAPEVARNLRNYLWGIFEYAIDTGLIDNNPVPPVRVLKKRQQANHPALPAEQIGNFLRKLDADDALEDKTRIAMLMVLLSACRKAEVIEAKWGELDLKNAQWEIPAERMKAKRPHWVPLSKQAIGLLAKLRKLVARDQEYLFPNRRDPRRPMANRSLNAVMERLGFRGEGTPHGMRAAFSTHFNSISANADVIELCLAHVPSNKVRAAYNRHAYRDERRAMLQEWAEHLDKVRRTRPIESDAAPKVRMKVHMHEKSATRRHRDVCATT